MTDRGLDDLLRGAMLAEAEQVSADHLTLDTERRPAPALTPTRRYRGALLVAAAVAVLLGAVGVLRLGETSEPTVLTSEGTDEEVPSDAVGSSFPGLSAHAELTQKSAGFAGVEVELGSLFGATGAWAVHELRFHNGTRETLYLADFRRSVMLGDPAALLVGVGGCGYSASIPDGPVHAGVCTVDLRPPTEIAPGESAGFKITVWRELAGMTAPAPAASYDLDLRIRYQFGETFDPADASSDLATVAVRLTYEVEELPAAGSPLGELELPAPGEAEPHRLDDNRPVWVVHHPDGQVSVLDARSTHQPDPGRDQLVGWCQPNRGFQDPAYGSVWDEHGRVRGGPAPEGLPIYLTRPSRETVVVLAGPVPQPSERDGGLPASTDEPPDCLGEQRPLLHHDGRLVPGEVGGH
jgi:hypothetical protein